MKVKALEEKVKLGDQKVDRMEKFLADDRSFREEVKKLEERFGDLVTDDMRERLHLEKSHVYGQRINVNLEDALRNLNEARQIAGETAEILNADTDKLKLALLAVNPGHADTKHQA